MKTTKHTQRAALVAGSLVVAGISQSEAGTLAMPDPLNFTAGSNSFAVTIAQASIEWFSFTTPAISGGETLDFTAAATISGGFFDGLLGDSEIALYDSSLSLVDQDDNSVGFSPFLEYGDAGGNGTLAAGTYFLGVGAANLDGILGTGTTTFSPAAGDAFSTSTIALNGTLTVNSTVPAAVPEPARAGLLFLGLCAAGAASRKRHGSN